MPEFPEDSLEMTGTVWTARLMAGLWCLFWITRIDSRKTELKSIPLRTLWTAAGVALAVHSAWAFFVIHRGSQSEAWKHTARRTQEVTGWNWGGGIVINEVLVVWWLLDAGLLWRTPIPQQLQSRVYRLMLHCVLAFLMFNATVVFGPSSYRWSGLGFVGILAALAKLRRTFN